METVDLVLCGDWMPHGRTTFVLVVSTGQGPQSHWRWRLNYPNVLMPAKYHKA